MSDGFLGRWSRRKQEAREGRALADEPVDAQAPARDEPPAPAPHADVRAPEAPAVEHTPDPPPTLADVQALTAESDFSRFAARDVPADVKNAALKKLFSDPRYNVMDGLDVYIDDYTQPQPLPAHLVSQLAGAAVLRLIDEPAAPQPAGEPRDDADDRTASPVAQSGSAATLPSDHADPDLRLQQDDAARRGEPGADAA